MRHIEFQLPGIKLAGLAWGDENAPVVLALHGWLDNANSFSPMAKFWHHYCPDMQLVAIDLPGHGYSEHRGEDAYYHFVDWIDVLFQLFDSENWSAIPLIGHSMGGMIATAFAGAFPEKVTKLALIESLGFVTGSEQQTAKQLRRGLLSRYQRSLKASTSANSIEAFIQARMNVSDLDHTNAAILIERSLKVAEEGYRWRSDAKLRLETPLRMTLEQGRALCSAVSCPVQAIIAESGFDMVKSAVNLYKNTFAELNLHRVPGGHHPHMQHADTITKLIVDFLLFSK
jgi:pimeloyl-ACP methyl ester carboxylesterase